MSGLFLLQICWRWVEKERSFFILWILTPSKPKNKAKYSHSKC